MTQLEVKTVKSRKEHVCDLCLGVIEINTDYERQTNVCDGEIYHFKSHLHCSFLAKHYEMYRDCYDEGLTSEIFGEDIDEIFRGEATVEEKSKLLYDEIKTKNPESKCNQL